MSRTKAIDLRQHALAILAPVLALASVPAVAADMVGLDKSGRIVRFAESKPGVATWRTIKGASAPILGIDVRPSNGTLYGLAADGGIYTIDPGSGEAKLASRLSVAAAADATVVDFNPVADRLRVITAGGRSLRVNVDTGETVEDGKLAFAAGDPGAPRAPAVTAGGYVNSTPGPKPAGTALYEIDSKAKALVLQDPPNAGTLQTKAALRMPARELRGLDIVTDAAGRHTGYAVNGAKLYRVDIGSGRIALVANIGKGDAQLIDVAAMPAK
ncbi:MAG: DUF4394 domain-containing protein [Alphaproteobacteria bacterium]|nr:DUF4394 domain-containing protein [Alphaproteobacteria bacterium]